MRKIIAALLALAAVFAFPVRAGDPSRLFFPDMLPPNTIICLTPPDGNSLEREYSGSLFHRLESIPEMADFLRSFGESRRQLAEDLARTAGGMPPQFAAELLEAKLGLALIDAGIGRSGEPAAEFAAVLALRSRPDRAIVFSAVMSLLNRPEIVRRILKSQGMDPNLPLKTLAQEETVSGYPPILRIGPDIRVAALGNLVLFYFGQGSEGITRLFNAAANPAASLSRNPLFQAAWRGSEASPGSSFVYVNVPRLLSVLDVLSLDSASRAIDAIGLSRVQSLGVSGSYRQEGVRHNLFLFSPGGRMEGVLASLLPVPPEWKVGMEAFARSVPASSGSFMALRVNPQSFLRDFSYLLDMAGDFSFPGGLSGVVADERVLGVPVLEVAQALGSQIIIQSHDDGRVAVFPNVNVTAFEAMIARMEKNAGSGFSSVEADGRVIRYFNRRASLRAPLAPAFFLAPRGSGGQSGVLYAASHPQTLVSLVRESPPSPDMTAREPAAAAGDFRKVASGLSDGYSLFYYNGDRDCYRRIYNELLLPLASLWAGSSRYPVDTGLLPTSGAVTRGMFGFGVGVKGTADGMLAQFFSPVGINALAIIVLDSLVVSNPLVLGYLFTRLEPLPGLMPNW